MLGPRASRFRSSRDRLVGINPRRFFLVNRVGGAIVVDALAYLIDTGVQKLLLGSPDRNPAFGGFPAQTGLQPGYVDGLKSAFPFINNWNTLLAGLNYPDVPNAEAYMPNLFDAWGRIQGFGDALTSTPGFDLPAEEATLESDLTNIFNTEPPPPPGRTLLHWFIGFTTIADPARISIELDVANDFNVSQEEVFLVPDFVSFDTAPAILANELAAGEAPDLVGPAGWYHSNLFHGQWLDLAPLIASSGFDTGIFAPNLYQMYFTDEGQVGLPFAVYPSALYYNPALFDAAHLNYPPDRYGSEYILPDGTNMPWSWQTVAKVRCGKPDFCETGPVNRVSIATRSGVSSPQGSGVSAGGQTGAHNRRRDPKGLS